MMVPILKLNDEFQTNSMLRTSPWGDSTAKGNIKAQIKPSFSQLIARILQVPKF